jgi:hypothetical protein
VNVVARGDQGCGALVVRLEGGSIPVVAICVGFDHDALGRPEEVHQVPVDENIHSGRRQALFPAEGKEIDLQARSGVPGVRMDPVDDRPESSYAFVTPG